MQDQAKDTKTRTPPSRRARIALALFSTLLTLLGLELAIRLSDASRGRGFFYSGRNLVQSASGKLIPFRTFGFDPYIQTNGVRRISSRHGELYPVEKSPDTFRIVVFGGSTTENRLAMEAANIHYPAQLQQDLRERLGRDTIEVINVGNAAYATPHSLIFLELDVLSWQPDLVILSHNANDRSAAYWPGFRFDYANKYGDAFYTGQDYRKRFTIMNILCQHSQLYWVLHKQLGDFRNRSAPQVEVQSVGTTPDPTAANVFRRNLKSFIALAQANGIEVILASQARDPTKKSRGVFVRPSTPGVSWPLPEELKAHHAAYNGMLKEVAAREGAHFVDNAAMLSGTPAYFEDPIHYSVSGIKQLARNYADFILEHQLISPTPTAP